MKMRDVLWVLAVVASIAVMVASGAVVILGLINLFTIGLNWPVFLGALVVLIASCYINAELMGD